MRVVFSRTGSRPQTSLCRVCGDRCFRELYLSLSYLMRGVHLLLWSYGNPLGAKNLFPHTIYLFSLIQGAFYKPYSFLRKIEKSLILKILQILEELEHRGKDISLIWISSHLNITGNEQADCAAKEAIVTGIDSNILFPPSDFSASWRDRMCRRLFEWAENRGLSKGSYFFNRFSMRCCKPWFHNFKFKRKSVVSINRLRSGHTTLAECLFNHKVIESPLCECGDIQSPITCFGNVSIWRCREKNFYGLSLLRVWRPFCIEQFLHTMNSDMTLALAAFIDAIPTRI